MTNIDVARNAYLAFNGVDLDAVLSVLDCTIVWRPALGNPYRPTGGAWIGHDAIIENLFARLATEWEGFAFHPEQYHDAGDRIVVEGRYFGTCRTTGKTLSAPACHILSIKDEKITHFQQYLDTAQLQDVMGV
ncbi:MAG TPA: nuclear transport factor 2 family protein [Sphingobium sp.]